MRTLAEHESLAVLRDHGIPVVAETIVDTPAAAVAAADQLGFPVVVKLAGPGLTHKSERGLVRLGLAGPADVETAAHDLLTAARPDDGPVQLVVAPMLHGARELLVGAHDDPQFGPCVLVGLGGVLAEGLDDVAVRLAPIERRDGHEMLDDLRATAILGAFRGEPPVDRDQVAAILVTLSELMTSHTDIASIDVNPLVVTDAGPVAVDALVVLRA